MKGANLCAAFADFGQIGGLSTFFKICFLRRLNTEAWVCIAECLVQNIVELL